MKTSEEDLMCYARLTRKTNYIHWGKSKEWLLTRNKSLNSYKEWPGFYSIHWRVISLVRNKLDLKGLKSFTKKDNYKYTSTKNRMNLL